MDFKNTALQNYPFCAMKKKIPIIAPAILLLLLVFCKERQANTDVRVHKESTIKANFESFINNGWNNGDMKKVKAIADENYIRTLNGITVATHHNEMEANMNIFTEGFPDCKITIEQIFLKDNNLFAQWTFKGTNNGVFGESAPTGKKVRIRGCSALLFNDQGKIAKEDVFYNELELLQQLGYSLIPPILE